MQEGQFFTWEALSAMGGASLLTFFIVQYTKNLIDSYLKLPTDIYAAGVAFGVLILTQLALGADWTDWRLYALTFANSFLVGAQSAQIQHKSVNPPVVKNGSPGADEKEGQVMVNGKRL
ncbi:hypothetical protein GCM10023310_01110 [Paenibacillus vulneris]|uniref:Holin n=1 Tax=Paenibacillus vulneris TaxID=1133364 RepID=A0ABW3V162_9BACL